MNNITLKDENESDISLFHLKGKKIVLFFYPKDNTSGCTKEAKEFSDKKDIFEALNVAVYGISKDSVTSHQTFIKKQNLSVNLLSDPDMKLIQAFDVWKEKKNYGKTYMGIVRTTILLDEDTHVIKRWDNVRVNGHVDAVLNIIKEGQ
jgi:thioredoxin-dependent peroxiredoxin